MHGIFFERNLVRLKATLKLRNPIASIYDVRIHFRGYQSVYNQYNARSNDLVNFFLCQKLSTVIRAFGLLFHDISSCNRYICIT